MDKNSPRVNTKLSKKLSVRILINNIQFSRRVTSKTVLGRATKGCNFKKCKTDAMASCEDPIVYRPSCKVTIRVQFTPFLWFCEVATQKYIVFYNYTHVFDASPGFNFKLLEKICKDIEFDTLPAFKKNVSVVFDKMKIKSGLVYTSKGTLVGFCDLGELNNGLQRFQQMSTDLSKPTIASHVFAVMVRGIFTRLQSPFGYFPCTAMSDQLYNIIWEGVEMLHTVGLHVRAFVSDGASTNRKFYEQSSQHNVLYCFGRGPTILSCRGQLQLQSSTVLPPCHPRAVVAGRARRRMKCSVVAASAQFVDAEAAVDAREEEEDGSSGNTTRRQYDWKEGYQEAMAVYWEDHSLETGETSP